MLPRWPCSRRSTTPAYANEAAMEAGHQDSRQGLADRPPQRLQDHDRRRPGRRCRQDPGTLTLTAKLNAPLYFVALVGIKEMNMTIVSQATKGSQDLEVAGRARRHRLDGQRRQDRRADRLPQTRWSISSSSTAASGPTYTKMALVPWSMGVNVEQRHRRRARDADRSQDRSRRLPGRAAPTRRSAAITRAKATRGRVTTTGRAWSRQPATSSGSAASQMPASSSGWTTLNNRKYTITESTTHDAVHAQRRQHQHVELHRHTAAGGTVRKCLNAELRDRGHKHRPRACRTATRSFFTGVGGMTQLNTSCGGHHGRDPDAASRSQCGHQLYQYLCAQRHRRTHVNVHRVHLRRDSPVRDVRLPVPELHPPDSPAVGHAAILASSTSAPMRHRTHDLALPVHRHGPGHRARGPELPRRLQRLPRPTRLSR